MIASVHGKYCIIHVTFVRIVLLLTWFIATRSMIIETFTNLQKKIQRLIVLSLTPQFDAARLLCTL